MRPAPIPPNELADAVQRSLAESHQRAIEDMPNVRRPLHHGAAIVVHRRTGETQIAPILVTDFYGGTEC